MAIQTAACRTQQRLQLQKLRPGDGSRAVSAKANGAPSSHLQGSISQGPQEALLDRLPEDLLNRIYSHVPLQDAARSACVSRGFLHSWKHYRSLTFNEKTLGLNDTKLGLDEETLALHGKAYKLDKIENYLVDRIDHILKNHSGFGVETLKLQLYPCSNIDASCLDSWLQIAIKSGIKELALELSLYIKTAYNFPCALLSNEVGSSIQYLRLSSCTFRPTKTLGLLRRLTRLYLHSVNINDEELGHVISNSSALETLEIFSCNEIVCLTIPCTLYQLSFMRVSGCKMLHTFEINAPKLCTFQYGGAPAQFSFRDLLQLRDIHMLGFIHCGMIHYARTKLPSIAPSVESLTLSSHTETVNTPMVPDKFLYLKYLDILLSGKLIFSPSYDFFSLVSFLDASPALESFILHLKQDGIRHDSILGESSRGPEPSRQRLECRHGRLQNVTIMGFCSSKSLVELTCHILENTSSLKHLTLDTTHDDEQHFDKIDRCFTMSRVALMEALKSLEAIRRFIEGKVPSNVCFKVVGLCRQCQTNISYMP